MASVRSTAGVATLTRAVRSHAEADVPERGDDDAVSLPSPQLNDMRLMALRICERHPDTSLATVTALVEQAHAELAGAKVQSFRMILTERAVRRRLASAPARA